MTQKPVSEFTRSELVKLPEITEKRQKARNKLNRLTRFLIKQFTQPEVSGLANVPTDGALLIVANHIGDADELLKIAYLPREIVPVAKVELYDIPVLGRLLDAYGVIWIRRGQPDRKALRAALQGLAEGRAIMISPEGRESPTGSLEEATHGAAYLALRSRAPILPVTVTGTYNKIIYKNMLRFRRSHVTLTIGRTFRLEQEPDRRDSIEQGTEKIMLTLASQLPVEYRGVYGNLKTS